MPRNLGDIAAYLDPGLEVTVNGKDYRLPEPTAELSLFVLAVTQAAVPVVRAGGEVDAALLERLGQLPMPASLGDKSWHQAMLGDTYDELVADGVPWVYIEHLAGTVVAWILGGESAAERFYTQAIRPEASSPAPNRAARRATTRTRSASPTTSTAAATTTRVAASGSATKSRRTASSKTLSRSAGRKSSSTGAQ